jgi:hypothetical protein
MLLHAILYDASHVFLCLIVALNCYGFRNTEGALTIPSSAQYSRMDGFFIEGNYAYIADSQGPIYANSYPSKGKNVYQIAWDNPCGGPVETVATTPASGAVTATTISPTGMKNCASLGWTVVDNICTESDEGWPCNTAATYDQAETQCAAVGARVYGCSILDQLCVCVYRGCSIDIGSHVFTGLCCWLLLSQCRILRGIQYKQVACLANDPPSLTIASIEWSHNTEGARSKRLRRVPLPKRAAGWTACTFGPPPGVGWDQSTT